MQFYKEKIKLSQDKELAANKAMQEYFQKQFFK